MAICFFVMCCAKSLKHTQEVLKCIRLGEGTYENKTIMWQHLV
jgi:hypothetical protein